MKTNKFHVRNFEENKITIEEERKYRSPLAIFFIRNGILIFCVSLLFSTTVFTIALYSVMSSIKESTIVKHESNGVMVSFDGTNNSILNGTPITEEYASKVFDSAINVNTSDVGVVIKIKEVKLNDRIIVYYSDNTALVKYKDGTFLRVSSVNGKFGIDENGIINSNASTKKISGNIEYNKTLDISIIYLSDGSMEVTKDNTVFFVRNNDTTNKENLFYTNLSGVSLPINRDKEKIYYSDGTIKEGNYIVVGNNKYSIKEEKNIHDNIKIIYYDNGYAEVVKNNLSIMVRNSSHIVYDKHSFEIIDNLVNEIDIKDIMDIKEINLNNTNTDNMHYIIVLEETNDYAKHNVSRRLLNDYINFNIYVGGNKIYNNILNNNLKDNNMLEGISTNNNTYLLYKGNIEKLSSISIKIGMWISYENITNEYMNSAFIGTVKVYIESLN